MKKILAMASGSYIGGAEIVTLQVFEGLKKYGYSIFCLTNGWNDGDFHQRLQNLGVPFQTIKLGWYYLKKPLWTIDSLVHLPAALIKGNKTLKTIPHDLVYATSYRQLLLLYPFLKKPVVLHVHDPLGRDRNARWIIRWLDKKIYRYIAVSDFIKNDLIHGGVDENKISVIHNGIDVDSFPCSDIPNDPIKITLGIAGQIIPRKGHQDAIEALRILVERGHTNCQLYIVGKGDPDFVAELRRMISTYHLESYVVWRGFRASLPDIYQDIDILLAPTRTPEPFGMIAIEANALGIPVLAANTGGLPEIITHGENGWLVSPGAPEEIAAVLSRIFRQPFIIREYGHRGRRIVRERFSSDKQTRKIQELVSEIIQKEQIA